MTTVNIILLKIKRHKDGRHPVVLRYTQLRKRSYISTGYACFEHEWNPEINQFERVVDGFRKKNLMIRGWLEQAKIVLNEFACHDEPISFIAFRKNFQQAIFKRATVSKYFRETVLQLKDNNQQSNAAVYRNTHQYVMKFTRGHDLLFNDIDKEFLNGFRAFMSSQISRRGFKVSPHTTQIYFRTLRALYNKAIDEGLVEKDNYPFVNKSNPDGFRIPKPGSSVKRMALNKDQVKQIIEYSAIPRTSHFNAKNYFVFSYLAGGMDFQDLALLKWPAIHGDRMEYTRLRTGKKYVIRINKEMQKILDHYWKHQSKYVFPVLNETDVQSGRQKQLIRTARKQFNENMTEIAHFLGINMKITSGMIRHTFASVLYREGAPLPEISMALKHNNVLQTKAYLEDIEVEVRDGLQNLLL